MQNSQQIFKLHSEYKPTGDQPQAIEKLVKLSLIHIFASELLNKTEISHEEDNQLQEALKTLQ